MAGLSVVGTAVLTPRCVTDMGSDPSRSALYGEGPRRVDAGALDGPDQPQSVSSCCSTWSIVFWPVRMPCTPAPRSTLILPLVHSVEGNARFLSEARMDATGL